MVGKHAKIHGNIKPFVYVVNLPSEDQVRITIWPWGFPEVQYRKEGIGDWSPPLYMYPESVLTHDSDETMVLPRIDNE